MRNFVFILELPLDKRSSISEHQSPFEKNSHLTAAGSDSLSRAVLVLALPCLPPLQRAHRYGLGLQQRGFGVASQWGPAERLCSAPGQRRSCCCWAELSTFRRSEAGSGSVRGGLVAAGGLSLSWRSFWWTCRKSFLLISGESDPMTSFKNNYNILADGLVYWCRSYRGINIKLRPFPN